MKKSKFTEMQIVKILKEVEAGRAATMCAASKAYQEVPIIGGSPNTAVWKPLTSNA